VDPSNYSLEIMRVLSLDLDFFMNRRVTSRADKIDSRPDNYDLVPWQPEVVVQYLENTLNLKGRIPGKVVVSHHEVFFHWRNLIELDRLAAPFFVCHVDAHADLGMGLPSWVYLHSDFLELSLADRAHPMVDIWGLNFGSFMAFAVANRWFSEIDFVVPIFWHDDIPQVLLTEAHVSRNGEFIKPDTELHIELMYAPREQIEPVHLCRPFMDVRKSVGEPTIPFNIIAERSVGRRYEGKQWDYVFLSHSPGYVPSVADGLLPIIGAYIDEL
jgi:hypothetical protein